MNSLIADVRFGVRMLVKAPGFTLVALLTLALGIAVNTAVFSWIERVLLHPLPGVSAAEELVSFETSTPNGEYIPTSYPDYRDYRDRLTLVDGLAGATPAAFSLGADDHSERVWGELVTGNYFAVLGVEPILGRVFSLQEYGDAQGGYPVVVIGEDLWQARFRRDPAVLGQTVRVNRQQLTIVGVVPASFGGSRTGLNFAMWVPVVMAPQLNVMPEGMLRDRKSRMLFGIARLKPGVSAGAVQAEITAVSQQMAKDHPASNRGITASVFDVTDGHFGAQALLRGPLRILMAVGGVVLLIVCGNVATLLLARATARQKELSLRLALGAGRLRIVRQLFVENLILSAAAAVFGVPLASWMSRALGYLLPDGGQPVGFDAGINGGVLLFTVVLCVGASMLSGIAPALQAVKLDLNASLKEGGRTGSSSGPSQRVRSFLVVSEVALALVAIIGAGLFARSFQLARQINPGFEPQGVVVSNLHLSSSGYNVAERINFCARLRERLEAEPGITAVSYADYIPLGFADGSWEDLTIEGYVPGDSENMKIYRTIVAPGYFDVMRIPLVEGRDFNELDNRDAPSVIIVNRKFVERFYGGANPIGRKVRGWGRWFTIVGVVKDTKFHTPNEEQRALFFVPFRQVYREDNAIAFYARTAGDSRTAVAALQRHVRELDPHVGIFDAMPLGEYLTASLYAQKVAASLLGALSVMALGLAAIGLYSVMAYSITQRTQEIGIRMALGASTGYVLALVIRQAMRMVLAGTAAGLVAAAALTHTASALLVGVSPTEPLIFLAAAAFLCTVALVAASVPAFRAARLDPNAALHCQ